MDFELAGDFGNFDPSEMEETCSFTGGFELNDMELPEFSMLEQAEIDNFILGEKAEATKSKETSDYRQLKRFFSKINENREIEIIPVAQLDNLLCQFFMNAVSTKGELYEPDTLTGFFNAYLALGVLKSISRKIPHLLIAEKF